MLNVVEVGLNVASLSDVDLVILEIVEQATNNLYESKSDPSALIASNMEQKICFKKCFLIQGKCHLLSPLGNSLPYC